MPSTRTVEPTRRSTDVVGGRIAAQLVDLVVQFVQLLAVGMVLAVLVRPETESGLDGLIALGALTLPLYGGVLEGYWNGQTVGKRLFGIKVVDRRGETPTAGQALVRNLPAVVVFSWVTVAVALAAIAMGDRRQRLFDSAAGTYVVRA